MKLIVGLGNPGRKYHHTRHNVGFEVAARLAGEYGTSRPREKFHGELVEGSVDGESLLILCPQTFMNLSGNSVGAAVEFYRMDLTEMLVVCDDFNLPVGQLRFRSKGSSGGQKGLAHIMQRLAADTVPRLRLGVGPLPANRDPADFVLGRFSSGESVEVQSMVERAATAAADWVRWGIQRCMNTYNVCNKET